MLLGICIFFFIFSIVQLVHQVKHFLSLLLVFEILTICVYIFSLGLRECSFSLVSHFLGVLILCIAVAETVIGMAILVSCSRFGRKSHVNSFRLLGF